MFLTGVSRDGDNYSRQVTEVHSEAFLKGWLACLAELGVPEDNPAWAKATPASEFLEPPAPYLPIILSAFDEEEYVNRPKEDETADDVVALSNKAAQLVDEASDDVVTPSNEAAQLADEVGQTAVEGTSEDVALELPLEP